jgi:hypothetical protein
LQGRQGRPDARIHCVMPTQPGLRGGVLATFLLVVALLQGCVYAPRTVQVYDDGCRIETRRMELELYQVGYFAGCSNEGCLTLLVAAGMVTAATAVVSGSIVIAGNIVYWFEKQGRCQ